jgi:hypothetical protein
MRAFCASESKDLRVLLQLQLRLLFLLVIPEGDLLLLLRFSLSVLLVILSVAKNPCISRGERSDPSKEYP